MFRRDRFRVKLNTEHGILNMLYAHNHTVACRRGHFKNFR